MSLSDILQVQQREREAKAAKMREMSVLKMILNKKKEEERLQKIKDEESRKEQEEEEKLRLEEIRQQKEIEHKTKQYFVLNDFNRRVAAPSHPYYFGEHTGPRVKQVKKKGNEGSATEIWLPHGQGEFYVDDNLKLEGNFVQGDLQGLGAYVFEKDNSRYDGEFQVGNMHGKGTITPAPNKPPRNVLMRKNHVLCYQEELLDGKQIEFDDPSMHIITENRRPRATILHHMYNYRYMFRFHDNIRPQERSIDLSTISNFKILHDHPQIYPLTHFGLPMEADPVYSYYDDVFHKSQTTGSSMPKLRIAGGRRTSSMSQLDTCTIKPENRLHSLHDENIFESRAFGIGAAQEAEDDEIRKILKKKQWALLIEQRRADEEQSRQKKVEEEQAKYMQDSISKQRKLTEARKQEEEEMEQLKQKMMADVDNTLKTHG